MLSGGVAHSWEVVTEARRDEYARYEAVGKPLWSKAEGWHTLEPTDDGVGTKLTFVETYHAYNPVMRALFEARVHRFISRNNEGPPFDGKIGTATCHRLEIVERESVERVDDCGDPHPMSRHPSERPGLRAVRMHEVVPRPPEHPDEFAHPQPIRSQVEIGSHVPQR